MSSGITELFTQLAINLKTLQHPTVKNYSNEEEEKAISILNKSLNLDTENGRIRVLDTALSLMCFKSLQVCDTLVKYQVNTLVTVLSSSVACKPLKLQKEEYMRVGGEISTSDCAELIVSCADILQKLEGQGISYQPLLFALIKAVVSASCFRRGVGIVPILDSNSLERGKPAVSKLLCRLPRDLLFKNDEVPLRLLFWYLDPMILKNDVSNILKDAMVRPFICLEAAFYERVEWHSVVMCLAFSPALFVETRSLLHNWFLMTGLASVLELEIALVSSILDVVSRPMRWGLSMELGLKLPSSSAYFADNHPLLRTLEGPILCQNLLHIVNIRNKLAHHTQALDHRSPWAMAVNFPNWFYFASALLFRGKSIQDDAAIYEQPSVIEPAYITAARYVAWIVFPTNETHQEMLVEFLTRASESWVYRKGPEKDFKQQKSVCRKKLKKPRTHNSKDDYTLVQLWLQEFQDTYINYLRKTQHNCSQGISSQQNVLLRRIPLGIVIGYSHEMDDDDGFQLLLHYAATGKLFKSQGLASSVKKSVNCYKSNEAVAGARLVFDLTDVVESMSGSLFETEESGVEFICRVKMRMGRYLLNCIKRLLEIEKGNGAFNFRDLYTRLVQWRVLGNIVSSMAEDVDYIIDSLSHRLSSL